MLYVGEDIKRLIPQRDPIMMVDRVERAAGDEAVTGLLIGADNYFVDTDGLMAEPGLIEHIAQSASAFAGHRALEAGLPLPVGYIGEVKKFHCYRRPAVGTTLRTTVRMGADVNGVTLLTAETCADDGAAVADTQMKIFVAP